MYSELEQNYTVMDYYGEIGDLIAQMNNEPMIIDRSTLVVPSVSGPWTPETVWDTPLLPAYSSRFAYLSVQQ